MLHLRELTASTDRCEFVQVHTACAVSHINVWEKIVAMGVPAREKGEANPATGGDGDDGEDALVLILEDDVEVLPECLPVLAALGEKDDWDLAKLYCHHAGMPLRKRALTSSHHLVVHLMLTTSSAGYAVNRRAAEILLKSMRPISEQVDHALDRPWETGLRIRGVRPLPIILAPVAEITTMAYGPRGDRSLPFRRAVRLFLSRAGKEISRLVNSLSEGIRR